MQPQPRDSAWARQSLQGIGAAGESGGCLCRAPFHPHENRCIRSVPPVAFRKQPVPTPPVRMRGFSVRRAMVPGGFVCGSLCLLISALSLFPLGSPRPLALRSRRWPVPRGSGGDPWQSSANISNRNPRPFGESSPRGRRAFMNHAVRGTGPAAQLRSPVVSPSKLTPPIMKLSTRPSGKAMLGRKMDPDLSSALTQTALGERPAPGPSSAMAAGGSNPLNLATFHQSISGHGQWVDQAGRRSEQQAQLLGDVMRDVPVFVALAICPTW